MQLALVLFLCFWADVSSGRKTEIILKADQPFRRVAVFREVTIRCCYECPAKPRVTWIVNTLTSNGTTQLELVPLSGELEASEITQGDSVCSQLVFKSVRLGHMGLYRCFLNHTQYVSTISHGTFLQVYEPLEKTLNLSENVKNSIITAEAVLLLLCLLFPGTVLLCKSKRLNELQKRKEREEENIYEGLNLDDCNSAYHPIRRSNMQGTYQDVASCGERIQLEKP